MYGFIEPDDYELYHDLHGPDDCGVLRNVTFMRVMLSYTGPGPINSVVCTSGPDEPVKGCNALMDLC